ncbi:hypothetical protein K2Z84_33325 [Candidatus Binatia bacterium]|nr:hypothetical protein [Candidatus Binatia bacterium]
MLRSPRFPIVLASLVVLVAAGAARAQSGATLSPDRLSYMVNKDLAGERWTINLDLSTAEPRQLLNATGNVFKPDGSPPVFVLCQIRDDSTGDLADPSSTFRFTCQGADACATTATECAQTGWSVISRDVQIPASFFLPPNGNGSEPLASSAAGAAALVARHGFAAIALARVRALWGGLQRWLADPVEVAGIVPRRAWAGVEASRGATLTYDGYNYLVNKDLGGQRWSISLNLVPVQNDDGTFRNDVVSLTGNVFKPDGSAPSFIHCVPRPDSTGTLDDLGSTFRFTCDGTSACEDTALGCAASAWTLIGDDVQLSASFLLPPGGLPATPQSDPEIVIIGRTSDPPSIISTDFDLTGDPAADASTAASVAGACPTGAGCSVRVGGCDAVLGKVVLTDQDVCGCRLDEVPASCITCGDGATGSCGGGCSFPVGNTGLIARGLCLPFASGADGCACYAIGAGRKLAVQHCGGTVRARCPGQRCCADDPRDGCDADGGVDCPGLCVFAPGGECPGATDCVDASGDYSGTNRVDGTCTGPQGISIPISSSDASTFTIVQSGCSFVARANGDTFATGTISGNRLTATGTPRDFDIRGCSQSGSTQTFGGTLVGDQLELDGTITASGSCEFGDVTCTLDSSVSASR